MVGERRQYRSKATSAGTYLGVCLRPAFDRDVGRSKKLGGLSFRIQRENFKLFGRPDLVIVKKVYSMVVGEQSSPQVRKWQPNTCKKLPKRAIILHVVGTVGVQIGFVVDEP